MNLVDTLRDLITMTYHLIDRQTNTKIGTGVLLCLAILLTGCTSMSETNKKPVLYPNAQYTRVGTVQANRDIEYCLQKARDHGVHETQDGEIGKKAVGGAGGAGHATGQCGGNRGDVEPGLCQGRSRRR